MNTLPPALPALPELLVPAGDPARLRTALLYGAQALYLGGDALNLRANAPGFNPQELAQAVSEAKQCQARLYYCLNSLPQQKDLAALPLAIETAASAGVAAFIVADPGVLRLARRYAPNIPVHLSTQANTTNSEAIAFWLDQGLSRVNLARELSCRDIYAIRKALPEAELEVFVHGAMCLAVSGQCLLSSWLNDRPANQGRCTQPCRFTYKPLAQGSPASFCQGKESFDLEEAKRPGEALWSIEPAQPYSAFFAPHDLCLLPYLPWFLRNGIQAIKIEGRIKSPGYLAHVVDAYRTAMQVAAGPGPFDSQPFMDEVLNVVVRPLSTGFFLPGTRRLLSPALPPAPRPVLARLLEEIQPGIWQIEVQAKWESKTPAEYMLPGMRRPALIPGEFGLENHKKEMGTTLACGTRALLHTHTPGLAPGMLIRQGRELP